MDDPMMLCESSRRETALLGKSSALIRNCEGLKHLLGDTADELDQSLIREYFEIHEVDDWENILQLVRSTIYAAGDLAASGIPDEVNIDIQCTTMVLLN